MPPFSPRSFFLVTRHAITEYSYAKWFPYFTQTDSVVVPPLLEMAAAGRPVMVTQLITSAADVSNHFHSHRFGLFAEFYGPACCCAWRWHIGRLYSTQPPLLALRSCCLCAWPYNKVCIDFGLVRFCLASPGEAESLDKMYTNIFATKFCSFWIFM